MKKQPVCKTCGSDDISSDACATWNIDMQQWELSDTFDNKDCAACGCDNYIEWVEVQ